MENVYKQQKKQHPPNCKTEALEGDSLSLVLYKPLYKDTQDTGYISNSLCQIIPEKEKMPEANHMGKREKRNWIVSK